MALTDHFESKKTKTHISILAQRNAVPISEPNQYFKESPAATNLAQITVTNSTFPVVGDTLKVACDYNPPGAINAIFTPPGGNQVWNLSNLQVESSQNIVFQPPSAGTAAASVPGADLLTFGSPHPEEYFNVTSNVMESMGYFDKVLGFSGGTELVANTLFNYTPPIAERHAPLQFFDIYSSTSNSLEAFAPLDLDSSFQTSMLGLVPTLDSMRFRETHQRLDVVDAWGSMTIPGGTYDVLRVKRTEYRSRAIDVKVVPLGWIDISTIGGQQLFSLGTDTLTSFLFVNDQVKEYIAVADLNTSQNTVLKVTFRNSAPLSIPTCNPDSIPPIITCKNQVTPVQCSNQVNFIEAMAFDLCDSSVLITAKNDTIEGTCVGKFSVLRTWTATDGSGNASSCFRMVVVSDTIPPEITCRQIDTVECAKEIPTCSPDGLTSSMDNCDNQLTISCKDSPLALGCNVSFVRTYSAYDDCDNVGTCSITITVANNMPSSITCPENDTIRSCDEAEIAEAFDLWLNSAMASGCGNNVVTNDNVGPPPIAGGTVTVTFKNSTACDTVTCEASFTVAPLESAIELLTNDTICEGAGDTVKIKLSTTNGKAPFDFFFNDIITGSTDCSPVASGGTYIVMDTSMLTLCIANLRAGTYTLTLDSVADMNGCYDATNRSVTITILPKPVSKDGAKLIESCVQAGYNLADSIECNVPSTFIWYAVQAVGSNIPYNNPDVSGETVDPPGTDSIISDVLSNYSNIDQTIVYYVLPTSMDGCRGDSFYVSVTVQPAIINLVANDQVNITMDENCMKVISASDVIKNGGSCAELLTDITLSYPLGTNTYSPANKLDRSHLGYCMIFSVTDKITGNKTWGKLCVEDKAPPMINCRDTTITCFDLANFPKDGDEVPDNCGNPVKVKVAEESFEDYGCNGDPLLLGVVTRRLIATDQWGNSIDCTRKLYIAKTSLDSVLCPRDT
ncbi:MAG: PKD-like domain-containing protein, partial [Saprospiraceae bacterium]